MVLYPNLTNSFWTRRCGHAPELFREQPRRMTFKTENTGIVPWMIPIRKWRSLFVKPAIRFVQTRKRPLTWWQEIKKKIQTARLGLFEENRRRSALQVSHNLAARRPLQQLMQARLCWPSSSWRAIAIPPTSTKTLTEFGNCQNHPQQQCAPLMGSQRKRTVWRSIRNEFNNSKSAHRGRQ